MLKVTNQQNCVDKEKQKLNWTGNRKSAHCLSSSLGLGIFCFKSGDDDKMTKML